MFYASRRHVPVKLRTLVDFLRKESKQHVADECSRSSSIMNATRNDVPVQPIIV
jgi:hypothetical protein